MSEFREFERFATPAVNASLMPVMHRYLERFAGGIAEIGIPVAPHVMQSNGGAASPEAVQALPINTFFSGPAGGVIGAAGLARDAGLPDIITFDMGGTSTDVCLVKGGRPARINQREIAGFPVRTATIDLHTIGAGGGSIAWVDAGGLPKVGPMSAGAQPGPAAYGQGGTRPTVTDANVVLGRLNPRTLLDGRMSVFPERAEAALLDGLAAPLAMDLVDAAAGVIEIVNVNMMGAVRVISGARAERPVGLGGETVGAAARARLIAAFHGAHRTRYGYDMPEHAIELVTVRLTVRAARPAPPGEARAAGADTLAAARRETRSVWFPATGFVGTPVYDRARLPADAALDGPAIVEQMDATTVVPPGWDLRVDDAGNLILTREQATVAKAEAWHMQLTR